ncbi:hypothetical protein NG791_05500 [Laspinema sp. D1]|uniref:hypothetical protein n=1 Tax=Laspinema palackyanum TaxID=3231601 RepID=UPI003477542F|nr:hypothetical protein [Laspinema sp. D2b]
MSTLGQLQSTPLCLGLKDAIATENSLNTPGTASKEKQSDADVFILHNFIKFLPPVLGMDPIQVPIFVRFLFPDILVDF